MRFPDGTQVLNAELLELPDALGSVTVDDMHRHGGDRSDPETSE